MKYFLLLIQAIVALKAVNEVKVSFQDRTRTAEDFHLQSVFTSFFREHSHFWSCSEGGLPLVRRKIMESTTRTSLADLVQ